MVNLIQKVGALRQKVGEEGFDKKFFTFPPRLNPSIPSLISKKHAYKELNKQLKYFPFEVRTS